MKPSLVTEDFTDKVNEVVARFKRDAILVGIPEFDNARDDDSAIGNAAILAINHFGSTGHNIPPSPVLSIGVRNAKDDIADCFKHAAIEALSQGPQALERNYERAGLIAASSCKKVINDQDGLLPPAASTLRARKYITKAGFKGTKRLLVTGQVRNAITYIVQSIWGQ
jgi:hypothetical protein